MRIWPHKLFWTLPPPERLERFWYKVSIIISIIIIIIISIIIIIIIICMGLQNRAHLAAQIVRNAARIRHGLSAPRAFHL